MGHGEKGGYTTGAHCMDEKKYYQVIDAEQRRPSAPLAPPVKRTRLDRADNRQRPMGRPAVEDTMVQEGGEPSHELYPGRSARPGLVGPTVRGPHWGEPSRGLARAAAAGLPWSEALQCLDEGWGQPLCGPGWSGCAIWRPLARWTGPLCTHRIDWPATMRTKCCWSTSSSELGEKGAV